MHQEAKPKRADKPPFSGGTFARRVAAWFIDMLISCFVGVLSAVASGAFADTFETAAECAMAVAVLLGFFLRDWTWRGRSLGKRITGLTVLDKRTGERPSGRRLALRDVVVIAYPFDFILILATGRSIGDHLAHTVVIPNKAVSAWTKTLSEPTQEELQADARYTKKWLKRIGIGAAIFVLVALTGALIGLQSAKTTPEYETAYAYFIKSDVFQQLQVDEEQVWMNAYSLQTVNGQKTAQMWFAVGWKQYTVVCHSDGNGEWAVCKECTPF